MSGRILALSARFVIARTKSTSVSSVMPQQIQLTACTPLPTWSASQTAQAGCAGPLAGWLACRSVSTACTAGRARAESSPTTTIPAFMNA